jgi:hypothetical protein
VGKRRLIRRNAVLLAAGFVLASCWNDPPPPAPVYMMGTNRTMSQPASVAALPQAESKSLTPPAPRTAPSATVAAARQRASTPQEQPASPAAGKHSVNRRRRPRPPGRTPPSSTGKTRSPEGTQERNQRDDPA